MGTTYDVRIWKIKTRYSTTKGQRKPTSYGVQWAVAGERFYESFKNFAHADSYRSDLVTAARRGEAFDTTSGKPISWVRNEHMSWYDFACAYVDMKWSSAAATYRRTIAESLTTATAVLLSSDKGKPSDKQIRSALVGWAFNTARRNSAEQPEEVGRVLKWLARNTKPVSAFNDARVAREVLETVTRTLENKPAGPSVARQKRMIVSNALNYAVELNLLEKNPIKDIKWKAPKASRAIDHRSVPNPVQARTLLNAVREVQRSGPRLVAFFGAMYFAALRPEEVANLLKRNLSLPDEGWGELYVEEATPHAGKAWTDTGDARDKRQLKHRAVGDGRIVPCPPELTVLLHKHLAEFGVDAEGRVFHGENGGAVPLITYTRVWRAARAKAFTPEFVRSSLAARPYDLRHAAVSTWLNGGVPPTTVAKWAGHSVAVLLEVYAKCVTGQDVLARKQVETALGS